MPRRRPLRAAPALVRAPGTAGCGDGEEAKAEEEEALRVAYVAATRARDLLVVAALGEEERARGVG